MRSTKPQIIQGGMGVGVSNWVLAQAVASKGQLGVVSSVALDAILLRRLALGDQGGHMQRALAAFPDQAMAQRVAKMAGPVLPDDKTRFPTKPMPSHRRSAAIEERLIVSGFVEVWLAKQGHQGTVGINFLEKIQTTFLPTLYGAMLAGVDAVLMGAGIPKHVPGCITSLLNREPASIDVAIADAPRGENSLALAFDPNDHPGTFGVALDRPAFYPIVASNTLATMLVNKANGPVDGLIVEGPTAGGHNAPPRGPSKFDATGQPIYGPKDVVDVEGLKALGVPFWLAGGKASPEALQQALAQGAQGIQVGTLFAFCQESGMASDVKQAALQQIQTGKAEVHTDAKASPTGFPFKVLNVPGTLSDSAIHAERERICDLGYLRQAHMQPDGKIGWRCPAETEAGFVKKGGTCEQSQGRMCLCNGLMATIGLGQRTPAPGSAPGSGSSNQNNGTSLTVEPALVTCGEDLAPVKQLFAARVQSQDQSQISYNAESAIGYLLQDA